MPNEIPPRAPTEEDWESLNRKVEESMKAEREAEEKAKAKSAAEIEANLLLSKLGVKVKSQAASPPADSTVPGLPGKTTSQSVDLDLSGNNSGGGGKSGGSGGGSGGGSSGSGGSGPEKFMKNFSILLPALLLAGGILSLLNLNIKSYVEARDPPEVKIANAKVAEQMFKAEEAKENRKREEVAVKSGQTTSASQQKTSPCIIELGVLKGAVYFMPEICKAIVFVPSDQYPVTRFVPPWPLKRAEGVYALYDQGDGPLLCQTENPANPLYSSNGCEEVLKSLVFPRRIKLARMTTSTTIIPR